MFQIPTEIYAKLLRADDKSLALSNSINSWCNKNAVTLESKLRPERHGLDLTCDMKNLIVPIENWRLDFGEIVYTLRSTLDNLIFFCATLHLDPPKQPRSLYFPIFTDAQDFSKQAKKASSQLDPIVSELVEKIQPYHREKSEVEGSSEADPLFILNCLSNFDKHRMPIPFLVPPQEISFQQSCQFYSDEDASANIPPNVVIHVDALEHGKTVMEYITNCPIKVATGKFEIKAKVAIMVNGHARDIFEVIEQVRWYSRIIVNEFENTLTRKSTRTLT